MFTEDHKSLMKSAKEDLMQFGGRDGQEAIKAAQETENRQMEGQTSLQKGDVFTVPADDAEFNDCLIARKFNKNQIHNSTKTLFNFQVVFPSLNDCFR